MRLLEKAIENEQKQNIMLGRNSPDHYIIFSKWQIFPTIKHFACMLMYTVYS